MKEARMLLILAIVLLVIAIAGGVIIHPVLFALALVALALFLSGRRGSAVPCTCRWPVRAGGAGHPSRRSGQRRGKLVMAQLLGRGAVQHPGSVLAPAE